MKKIILLIAVLFVFKMQAQTYSISPSHVVSTNIPFNTLTIVDIFQVNTGSSPIVLSYELISNNLVQGWDFSLCDLGHCIPGFPAFSTMDTVQVGGQGFLGVNVDPYAIPGTGSVTYYVYQEGFKNNGDTLTWYFTAGTNGIENMIAKPSVNFFPNPASNFLNVNFSNIQAQDVVNINIYNALGQLMYSEKVDPLNEKMDVSFLSNGIYLVQLKDEKNTVFQNKKLIIEKK